MSRRLVNNPPIVYLTRDQVDSYAAKLYQEFVLDSLEGNMDEPWDSTSTNLRDVFDVEKSNRKFFRYRLDSMKAQGKGWIVHVSNISVQEDRNELVMFNKKNWVKIAKRTKYKKGGTTTVYQETESRCGVFLDKYYNGSLKNYLNEIDGQPCLLGSKFVMEMDSDKIQYSPHLTNKPTDNVRCYVRTDPALAMMAHRYKVDRAHVYGPNRSNGQVATLFLIDEKYWSALERVGLTDGDTLDIGSTTLPLRFGHAFEVTWRGNGIANAMFRKINL